MAVLKIKALNYISTGTTQKFINLDLEDSRNMIYATDISKNQNVMDGYVDSNKSSLKTSNNVIIHDLYDIKDICIKSSIKKIKNFDEYSGSSDDYLDIYAPVLEQNAIGFCQLNNYSYVLTLNDNKSPEFKGTTLLSQRESSTAANIKNTDYSYQIIPSIIDSYVYSSPDAILKSLSSHFIPKYDLKNMKSNFIFELPNFNTINNFYDAGDILGDVLVAKNQYDYLYSMNMTDQSTLSSSREYYGIGACSDKIFLKFIDNIDYSSLTYNTISSNINMVEKKQLKYPFMKIETVDSINRFKNSTNHKSSMYSIKIKNTSLNSLNDSSIPELQSLYNQIKLDINNNIRQIAKAICPVNTELFDIQIT